MHGSLSPLAFWLLQLLSLLVLTPISKSLTLTRQLAVLRRTCIKYIETV